MAEFLKWKRKLLCSLVTVMTFFRIADCQPVTLRINEFLAVNRSVLSDEDRDYSDWIEIYNPSAINVSLEGWSLTDSRSNLRKWIFPSVTLPGNGYIIVFASGKDRRIAGKKLHTNFRLNNTGEYLALTDPTGWISTEFSPKFPVQQEDKSYGFHAGSYMIFSNPTPGEANYPDPESLSGPPGFSRNHGFIYESFPLIITSDDKSAEIKYTLDGSAPGISAGTRYTGPVTISKTTVVRAVLLKGGKVISRIATGTYIFPDDVVLQNNTPPGYPALWGPYTGIKGTATADYEMDQELLSDPAFAARVKAALLGLPTISIVTDAGNLFSKSQHADSGGIYIYTGPPLTNTSSGLGFGWERPASVEYIDPGKQISFQIDCGLRLHGGHGRRAEKSPKHSFRLAFRGQYGHTKLNFPMFGNDADSSFDNLVLRAGFGNTWIHWSHSERAMAQYLRDRWTKDTQMAMGHYASHGVFVHLYINGLYWGIYNPSERMDKDFAAEYLGGDPEDYDVIKDYAEVADGDKFAWNRMMIMANEGLSGSEAYNRIKGTNPDGTRNPEYEPYVDVVNLADYMLLNFYGGNWDWDHHNWVAIRNRVNPGTGFKFFCWDAEHMVETVNANILSENNNNCPSRIFQQLVKNNEFKRLFADRVQKHCFGNGALSPQPSADRWKARASQIETAVEAEAARWGDYRRDVHRWSSGPYELYTKENHWNPQMEFMLNTYFPSRRDAFVESLRSAGLFPSVDAPVLMINNKSLINNTIKVGDTLSMTSPGGTVYYTIDGTDPVMWTGTPAVSARAMQYNGEFVLNRSTHIKARAKKDGEWSAVSENYFMVPGSYNDLKITEIHYYPLNEHVNDHIDYEFIELKNTGNSTIDLGGIGIKGGIRFRFPADTGLKPGEFILLASNPLKFFGRYGFYPYGQYSGQLDNAGEQLLLMSPRGDTLCYLNYCAEGSWPESAGGEGFSLVPVVHNPQGRQDNPGQWRASYHIGGSPGRDDIFRPGDQKTMTASSLLTIYQNYPNPFQHVTYIPYRLHNESDVEISVYNISGRKIITLCNSRKPEGEYVAGWKGCGSNGSLVGSGIYIVRITARSRNEEVSMTRRIVLSR